MDAQHPYLLTTPGGTVRAIHVFHCSNAFAGHLLPCLRGGIFSTRPTTPRQEQGPLFPDGARLCWRFYNTLGYSQSPGIFTKGLHYMQQNARTGDIFVGGERPWLGKYISSDDRGMSDDSRITHADDRVSQGWTELTWYGTQPRLTCGPASSGPRRTSSPSGGRSLQRRRKGWSSRRRMDRRRLQRTRRGPLLVKQRGGCKYGPGRRGPGVAA